MSNYFGSSLNSWSYPLWYAYFDSHKLSKYLDLSFWLRHSSLLLYSFFLGWSMMLNHSSNVVWMILISCSLLWYSLSNLLWYWQWFNWLKWNFIFLDSSTLFDWLCYSQYESDSFGDSKLHSDLLFDIHRYLFSSSHQWMQSNDLNYSFWSIYSSDSHWLIV